MKKTSRDYKKLKRSAVAFAAVVWALIITLLILNKDSITIDGIVGLTPANMFLAVLLFLFLFALKSITVVVYCGILYAASGIIFPLYLAIPVSLAGTAIMITIPFFVGKHLGNDELQALYQKYPKLKQLHEYRSQNDFLFAFLTRIIGMLPSDPISACMGASGICYKDYLFGSLLGMLPGAVAFTVMGMSANNVTSPAFLISLGFEIALTITTLVFVKIKENKTYHTLRRAEDGKKHSGL